MGLESPLIAVDMPGVGRTWRGDSNTFPFYPETEGQPRQKQGIKTAL